MGKPTSKGTDSGEWAREEGVKLQKVVPGARSHGARGPAREVGCNKMPVPRPPRSPEMEPSQSAPRGPRCGRTEKGARSRGGAGAGRRRPRRLSGAERRKPAAGGVAGGGARRDVAGPGRYQLRGGRLERRWTRVLAA